MIKALVLLAFLVTASAALAQDDDSFVTHVKSPAEVEYDNWLKDRQAKAEADEPQKEGSGSDDTDIDAFARRYFYAFRDGDAGALRGLVTQDNLRCLDSLQDDYFRSELSHSSHTGRIETLKWQSVDAGYGRDSANGTEPQPSAAARQVEISWREEALTARHNVTLIQDGGHYYMKIPCEEREPGQSRNQGGYGENGAFPER